MKATTTSGTPLGDCIRFHRRVHGWNQRKLAELVGVTQAAVAKWESGASVPAPSRLKILAGLFDVQMSTLIEKADAA